MMGEFAHATGNSTFRQLVAVRYRVGLSGWHKGHALSLFTSGLPWKLPGRVGDHTIIGAGLYADDQGPARRFATGIGEEILRFSVTSRVVEAMRHGASAQDACEGVIRFIVRRKPETTKTTVAILAVRQGRTDVAGANPPGFFRIRSQRQTHHRTK